MGDPDSQMIAMLFEIAAIPFDLLLVGLLTSFTIDTDVQRPLSRRRHTIVAGVAFVLLVLAVLVHSEGLYIAITLLYMAACVFLRTYSRRFRTIMATVFLALLAFLPLNTMLFLSNVLGVSLLGSDASVTSLFGALLDCVIIVGIYLLRKRNDDLVAIRFSAMEYAATVFIFIFTAMLGVILDPRTGLIPDTITAGTPGMITGEFLLVTVSVAVVLCNLLFLVMIWRSKTLEHYRAMNQESRRWLHTQVEYFHAYKQAQADVRRFRHDITHHITRMRELAESDSRDELRGYLRAYSGEWERVTTSLWRTGDDNVDAILNSKAASMRDQQITFTVLGSFISPLQLSPFDMCAIFANGLDNAIEENQRLARGGPRYITLSIRRTDNYYAITLENPTTDQEFTGATRKSDAVNHGWGLHSITATSKRNGGSATIRHEPDRFILELLLPVHSMGESSVRG